MSLADMMQVEVWQLFQSEMMLSKLSMMICQTLTACRWIPCGNGKHNFWRSMTWLDACLNQAKNPNSMMNQKQRKKMEKEIRKNNRRLKKNSLGISKDVKREKLHEETVSVNI